MWRYAGQTDNSGANEGRDSQAADIHGAATPRRLAEGQCNQALAITQVDAWKTQSVAWAWP